MIMNRCRMRMIGTSRHFCWLRPACSGTIESMEADLRIMGEEIDNKEELGFDAAGFGRDRIIRRMIGELPT